MERQLRIAFTGGGTGGHVYPLLAVVEEIKTVLDTRRDVDYELYYFGAPGPYAQELVAAGLTIRPILSAKVRRYMSALNVVDAFKMPFALVQALWKMFWVMPDVLFSKGGTGALPVVVAAFVYRVPIFIHESDSIPGLSNTISYRLARRVAVSFEKTREIWRGDKVALVGNPVRSFLLERDKTVNTQRAKQIFGLEVDTPMILVLGGSQGSARLNEFFLENAREIVGTFQILHQTGPDNFETFKAELAVVTKDFIPQQRQRYRIVNFFREEIKEALEAADVIVSRAGSGAVFEIALAGKPSILVPLKESARNHQFYNAYEYAKAGACIVVEEPNLTPAVFFLQVAHLLKDTQRHQEMAASARAFARPDAAHLIAEELVRVGGI